MNNRESSERVRGFRRGQRAGDPLQEPVSNSTRRARLGLILVSIISLILTKTGIFPARVPSLGLEFDLRDFVIILKLIDYVSIYLLAIFIICSVVDFLDWRITYNSLSRQLEDSRTAFEALDEKQEDNALVQKVLTLSRLRVAIELSVPLLLAIYALYSSLTLIY
jgi:hypothetical protein